MGHDEVAGLLEETLDEEKAADAKLTKLTEGGINRRAADGAHSDDDGTDDKAPAMPASKGKTTATTRTKKR